MRKYDFMHSTPFDVELFISEYDKRKKSETEVFFERMKYTAWLNGVYIRMAVASVLSKRAKYPKEPPGTEEESNGNHIVAREDMSESEKTELTKLLFSNLEEMQKDFERTNNPVGEGE